MNKKELIAECTAYDFKEMLEEQRPKSWLKSVSAFANGSGGSLFFGVANDGVVRGLEDIQRTIEIISSRIRDKMDPLPVFKSTNSQFMTTLYNVNNNVAEDVADELTENQHKILDLLRENVAVKVAVNTSFLAERMHVNRKRYNAR